MATFEEMAEKLRQKNPENSPMSLRYIAKILWPEAEWLNRRSTHHNGGAKVGALVAAGTMGRMQSRGLVERWIDPFDSSRISMWRLKNPTLSRGVLKAKKVGKKSQQRLDASTASGLLCESGDSVEPTPGEQ